MKIKVGDRVLDMKLVCSSHEYNCSVKMVGRLSLKVTTPEGKDIFVDGATHSAAMENKKQLIKDFGAWVVDKGSWPQLKDGARNKMFPQDSGTYLPNFLLYADVIMGMGKGHFYAGFTHLIAELESDPSYGWQIFKFPPYRNNTYGYTIRPSRVWGLVPPTMVQDLLVPGLIGQDRKGFSFPENLPAADYREIRQALGK